MAVRSKKLPGTTIRKILKAHTQKNIGQRVEALVYLDYLMFLEELMKNAEGRAKVAREKSIAARDIRRVTLTTLRKFRG